MKKMQSSMFRFALLFAVAGLMFGCSSAQKAPGGAHAIAEKSAMYEPTSTDPGTTGPTEREPMAGAMIPLDQLPDIEKYNVCPRIHFDYDQSEIKKEWVTCLDNIAKYFVDHPEFSLVIEGHCDERGTPEYNLALGERRANATADHIVKRGLDAGQIVTRSWGEERAIAACHEESCWWQNRRAEFFGVKRR
ncbi:MAG: OmpA family protein [bacterium]|jgi:peptidoglycan-associated lipoprotein|nr:OmpA family protein [bacterium]